VADPARGDSARASEPFGEGLPGGLDRQGLTAARRGSPAGIAGLQKILGERLGEKVHVELGMRYGKPSVAEALGRLKSLNVRRLLVLPLYPQYSATTTASTFDAVTNELTTWRWLPELRFVNHYHDEPGYIDALCDSIRNAAAEKGEPERSAVLVSRHP
jgi:protoheme ferro-lyase